MVVEQKDKLYNCCNCHAAHSSVYSCGECAFHLCLDCAGVRRVPAVKPLPVDDQVADEHDGEATSPEATALPTMTRAFSARRIKGSSHTFKVLPKLGTPEKSAGTPPAEPTTSPDPLPVLVDEPQKKRQRREPLAAGPVNSSESSAADSESSDACADSEPSS